MTVDILGKAIFHIRVSPPIKRFDLPQRIVRAEPPYPLSFIAGSLLFCESDTQSALSKDVNGHVAESTICETSARSTRVDMLTVVRE